MLTSLKRRLETIAKLFLLQSWLSYILHEDESSEGSGRPGRCHQALRLCYVVINR